VRSVLTFIADSAGMNMVISDGVTGTVTLTLKAVPARTALRAVLRVRALEVVEEDNVWMVMTDGEYEQRQKSRHR
jgi:type IV pilus assembly protein PilQ